ncbi:related to polyphosphoinositide phosphatase family member [Rhynchosporium secalis]|uniref:Related to polyphosphoinositide phosphatase family member n=1 Tax=Rhynchosporium secalis TaxID=38038 RepID=A0A1E1MR69_RHYSE|nr:related to polyphosphoinositide phosphatase family member [Rhynchosporium secalis]
MADQDDGPARRGRSPAPSDTASNHVHFNTASMSTDNASRSTSVMTSPLTGDFKNPNISDQSLPKFPPLHNNPPQSAEQLKRPSSGVDDEDDEESTARPFQRSTSPTSDLKRNKGAEYEKVGDLGVCKMHKFSLYETAQKYYFVGADVMDRRFRILKIDRTSDSGNLNISEDEIVYTKKEMSQLLNAIDDGNKSTGGMKLRSTTWGIIGFIRFTGVYYMLVIVKRSQVAMIGGHFTYSIDATELIPLTTGPSSRFKPDLRNTEESRFIGILNNLDLTRSFYYSYSYDITRTLQHNMLAEREALAKGMPYPHDQNYNSMFVWNSYLLKPAASALKNTYDWCMPVIHGYIDQSALSIYGRTAYITIIARRSRYFAGARFLKRGANDLGYVANDVETEQIVSEMLTTSFHAPGPKLFASPNFTSYVQHRGSIPLYWTQDNTGVTPKPPIELNLVDPFYSAAALHFDNLFERYGAPVYVLNLVKARERTPRESKLLVEFTNAITYLNQFLPADKKIIHKAWDMSRASKSRDQDVIGTLENIAEEVVTTTGFFHNGDGKITMPKVQNGVARTNCIDCLDRTNAAQFVIGKRALGHQLHALGIIGDTSIDYDTDAVNLFTHMYHDHGDTIAIQYGGSQLVNTMETYRKINQWTSHSRDMVESFKRYYNNSFLDGQRQEAYNLFLGNYIFAQGQPMLWDLATDYYLHHANPRLWSGKRRRSYINWYTPEFLEKRVLPPHVDPTSLMISKPLGYYDEYWLEYYKPLSVSSLLKVFSYMGKLNSTIRYIPFRSTQEGRYDLSPFKVRTELDQDVPDKKKVRKEVTIVDPADEVEAEGAADDNVSIKSGTTINTKRISIQRWLQPIHEKNGNHHHSIMKESAQPILSPQKQKLTPLDKSKAAQWTFTQVVHESLNPSVSAQEMDDYARYISHPQILPLVVSDAIPAEIDAEYLEYVNGSWRDIGIVTTGDEELGSGGEDVAAEEARDFLTVGENPLCVLEEDLGKKRYKAYRKWLAGKSLFKQQPID